jgi:penicillin-binding protein 1B
MALDREQVEDHLRRLGYRPSRGDGVGIGEYHLGPYGFIVGRRPFPWAEDLRQPRFVVARLDFDGRIAWLEDEEGRSLPGARLEPELIGRMLGPSDLDRLPVTLEEVPRHLVQALLTVEDRRFYEHGGLDLRRIAAAMAANLKAGQVVQGGSTITQQLARSLHLSTRRSVLRKAREAVMAVALELRHGKEEILQAYLNEIYLGQDGAVEIRGIGRGAEHFFGKEASALTLEESALLVALIRGPSLYSPFRHPEVAVERRNLVLRLMQGEGVISPEERERASRASLGVRKRAEPIRSIRYFLDYLDREMGSAPRGRAVVTSVDARLQRAAETAVARGLAGLERRFAWLRREQAGEPLQAALVALDPRTGEILAMVGGREYGASQFNRAVDARRQPGSAFKPVVALSALARPRDGETFSQSPRFTLASVLQDAPLRVETPAGLWEPANYDREYSGPVTLRQALERSLNVPFARLGLEVGPERIVETARRMGITSPLSPYPALALGAAEVSPLEMARAFGVLAAGGYRAEVTGVLGESSPAERGGPSSRGGGARPGASSPSATTGAGAEAQTPGSGQAFEPAETFLVTSALQGAVEHGTASGIRNRGFHGEVAAKSGTTNDYRDGWLVGYTPSLVVAVWVGFDHGRRLELPGAEVALPIFADFLRDAVGADGGAGEWGSEGFAEPSGVEWVEVDARTGLRGGWGCPGEPELFLAGTAPELTCGGYRVGGRSFRILAERGGEEVLRALRRLLLGEARRR